MFWSGVALAGLFLVNAVIAILPPMLLQPAWQLNVALALQSNGLQALIGCALLSVAPLVDSGNRRLQESAEKFRRIAAWICLGWLLLIPLQVSSGIQLLRQAQDASRIELRRLEQQIDLLRQVRDERSFRVQFALMAPTSPPFPQPLPASLELVRAEAVQQFTAQWRRQQTTLLRSQRDRAQAFLVQSLRNSLLSLLLSVGFAAIGRWQTNGPTILSELLQWFDPEHPGSFNQRLQAILKRLRRGLQKRSKPSPRPSGPPARRKRWLRQLNKQLESYLRKRRAARSQAAARARQRK